MSTRADIEVSYDVGNEFFRLWLDERMSYTCALWEPGDDLEAAQRRKLGYLSDLAGTGPGSRVLDIGCGWGANLEYQSLTRGVAAAHGITLSPAQVDEAAGRRIPRASVELADYREYVPAGTVNAVMCICMMEHIATPADVWSGRNLGKYRDFFRRVHSWTEPGTRFALQVILRDRVPRDPAHLAEVHWATHHVFPGGISLRLEDVVKTAAPRWEIMSIRTRRSDYERTTAEWLRRLRAHEPTIRRRWGDAVFTDYERYLAGCVMAFRHRYQSLAQIGLLRRDG
jgi:cyclopropane-fatty-acyl-phospholipid synthase